MRIIHHVVDVESPPSKVWWALTKPSGMASWWSTKVDTPKAAVGAQVHWTFAWDFNPVMELTGLEPERELNWRCVAGHDPWKDDTFRFLVDALDDGRTRLRFLAGLCR